MRTKDLVAMTATALGTAVLTVVMCWSGSIEAGGEGADLTPKIAIPKLMSRGVEITMTAADGHAFAAGEEPSFALQASNTTDKPVTMKLSFAMTGIGPAAAMSRLVSMPAILWQQQQEWVFEPKETKTVTIATHTILPAGKSISVSVQDQTPGPKQLGAGIVALTFATAALSAAAK
jgi:hypothetical protein